VATDVFGNQRRADLLGLEGETCLYRVPTTMRCSLSSTGQLMAPGMWSSANSAGERTSMISS
jgi:hypothetical protein